ncbi:calcium-binding protein [Paracoccus yeei]|nr:hypothetical protein [Paracoccus yeei]
MPTQGNDLITWGPGSGSLYIDGLGDSFDSNVYQPYQGSTGPTNGDMLRIEGAQAAFIRLDGWNQGAATAGDATATFTDVERVFATAGNDTVRAGQVSASGPDGHGISVFTGAGDDNIVGSRFGDFIDPGAGNDTVWAGDGDDFVNGSRGDDLIYGGAGNDNIRWGQGAEDGNWGDGGKAFGDDTVYGGAGADVINIWANNWDVDGANVTVTKVFADGAQKGFATIDWTGALETLEFQGFEQIWTHGGRDTFSAAGAQIVGDMGVRYNARWGDDRLVGSSGNDTLEGGTGADTITGGAGNDLISANGDFFSMSAPGDGDADTLIFRAGHGHDTVLAFDAGLDVLDLGGRDYRATDTAGGTLLTAGQDSILLAGIHDFEV